MSPMNNRLLRPTSNYDADALRYINAVQVADGQALEPEVRTAIDAFVRGCKADGIWSAIKASCIMAGARTISGALVPLVGDAPTPYNFTASDYNRTTGLKGDGSTTYLDSNRANDADGQDDNHNAVYVQAAASGVYLAAEGSTAGTNAIQAFGQLLYFRSRSSGADSGGSSSLTGLIATSRTSSGEYTVRRDGLSVVYSRTSQTPSATNLLVFNRSELDQFSAGRCAFYSIGSSLDLAALDNRVTTLIAAIASALS